VDPEDWYLTKVEKYDREGNPTKRLKGRCSLLSFSRFHNDTREGLPRERRVALFKFTGTYHSQPWWNPAGFL
jgi:hypothetical protein